MVLDPHRRPGEPLELRIRVTCINNVGNDSVTRGVVVESNLPIVPVGLGATARRVDNGEGQDSPPDQFFGMITGPSGGADCPLVPFPTLPAEQGSGARPRSNAVTLGEEASCGISRARDRCLFPRPAH